MSVVMDYPTAWAFVETTDATTHDPKCSWRTVQMLCDCHVLGDEYDRRAAVNPSRHTPGTLGMSPSIDSGAR